MASPVPERSADDLTARARIRDAALRLFAERGIAAATIRDIAAAAGVSSGLVRHHFGSKEALRDACDTYAMEWLDRFREQMFLEGRMADQAFVGSTHPMASLLQNYLVRSMLDGSATASDMFQRMVRVAEEWLSRLNVDSPDPRAWAAALVGTQAGLFLMPDQMSEALGVDVRSPAGQARMFGGLVDLFTYPLLTSEQAAQLHTMLDRFPSPPPTSGASGAARSEEFTDDDRGDSY
ncbi:TetR family transcriptional regulator [Micromonospora sp. NPDC049559]|uniref:TetR/AcrR family transcriptional regulator n=1 Tax=Micromonospora sp. NPDC049559 TaxID=3155923 RepID=UPI0034224F0C